MKISEDLLYKIINKNFDISVLSEKLTMLGFESVCLDEYLDITIPYNRQDCCNILELLHTVSKIDKTYAPNLDFCKNTKTFVTENITFNNNDSIFCPTYYGIIIKNLDIEIELPNYIKKILLLNKINLINPIVDVINFVTFLTGQPLHGYNLSFIKKNIILEKTKENVEFLTINNEKITILKNTPLLKSNNKIISLPGIIGSNETKITENTTDIFLESAFFKNDLINEISIKHNIITDSSKRFVNKINFKIIDIALTYASHLLCKFYNGNSSTIQKYCIKKQLPKNRYIKMYKKNLFSVIGHKIQDYEIKTCIEKFGLLYKHFKDHVIFNIPYYRNDLIIEENVIAEIIKLYGYDNILTISPKIELHKINYFTDYLFDIKTLLKNQNFNEIITYSFVDDVIEKTLNLCKKQISIENPISEKMTTMRTTLIQGLLNSLVFNLNRQINNLKLFELGNVYFYGEKNEIKYNNVISAVITSTKINNHESFFVLKKIIEQILTSIFSINDFYFTKSICTFLDKNVSMKIMVKNEECGSIGLINKNILKNFSIKQDVYLFSLNLNFKKNSVKKIFKEISKFPNAIRDLSIIVKNTIAYNEILFFLNKLNINNLINISFLDCFYFKIEDKKSITLRFKFQSVKTTLIDKEINYTMELIQNELKKKFLAEIKLK